MTPGVTCTVAGQRIDEANISQSDPVHACKPQIEKADRLHKAEQRTLFFCGAYHGIAHL